MFFNSEIVFFFFLRGRKEGLELIFLFKYIVIYLRRLDCSLVYIKVRVES